MFVLSLKKKSKKKVQWILSVGKKPQS